MIEQLTTLLNGTWEKPSVKESTIGAENMTIPSNSLGCDHIACCC